jgi:Malectin domain
MLTPFFSLCYTRRYWWNIGQRVFNMNVEGNTFNNIDVVKTAGKETAFTMRVTQVVVDGAVSIRLTNSVPQIDNPKISGIEIKRTLSAPTPVSSPVAPPVAPVAPPVLAPVASPVAPPVTVPTNAPPTPVSSPVAPPVAPVAPPVLAPVALPVTPPVTVPTNAPPTPTAPAFQDILINCGGTLLRSNLLLVKSPTHPAHQPPRSSGGAYLENSGLRTWAADKFYTLGNTFSDTSKAIANTLDDTIYQSERTGEFSYEIPVPTGNYEITVHLAEM